MLATLARNRPMLGACSTDSTNKQPNSRPMWADFGQIRPDFDRIWPDLDRSWPDIGQSRPQLARCWPNLARTKASRLRPTVARSRTRCDCTEFPIAPADSTRKSTTQYVQGNKTRRNTMPSPTATYHTTLQKAAALNKRMMAERLKLPQVAEQLLATRPCKVHPSILDSYEVASKLSKNCPTIADKLLQSMSSGLMSAQSGLMLNHLGKICPKKATCGTTCFLLWRGTTRRNRRRRRLRSCCPQ